jgi:hypothetical protein
MTEPSDWLPLREFVERWVDDKIAHELSPEARAVFTAHRDEICDLVEREMELDAARQQRAAELTGG